jgi:cobalamin biosynthesis protein CobW
VELANGCICCTVADDFVPALDQILSRSPKVDHILIETSGLASAKAAGAGFPVADVKSRVTVDGVVAVVDGAALADGKVASDMDALAAQRAADESLDHDDPVEEVFEDQVACADLIILSKSDLIDAEGAARQRGDVNEHIRPRREDRAEPPTARSIPRCCSASTSPSRTTSRTARPTMMTSSTTSTTISTPSCSNCLRRQPGRSAARVARAAEEENVLRVKGFVDVGKPMRLLVQAVGPRVNHYYDRAWTPADDRRSRLVVIGLKGLDRPAASILAG